jgi:hypothetical protein
MRHFIAVNREAGTGSGVKESSVAEMHCHQKEDERCYVKQ